MTASTTPSGEPLVQRRPAQQQPVVDGAEQELVGELDVGVGAQVAALDPACEQPVGLGDPHRHDLVLERLGQPGVGGEVGDEPLHDAAHDRRAEDGDGGVDEADELGARVAEVRGGDDLLDHVDQHGERELVLAAPAAVDGRLRDSGPRRDALDGEIPDAAFGEELTRGVEDRLVGAGAARERCRRRHHPETTRSVAQLLRS